MGNLKCLPYTPGPNWTSGAFLRGKAEGRVAMAVKTGGRVWERQFFWSPFRDTAVNEIQGLSALNILRVWRSAT